MTIQEQFVIWLLNVNTQKSLLVFPLISLSHLISQHKMACIKYLLKEPQNIMCYVTDTIYGFYSMQTKKKDILFLNEKFVRHD